MHRKSDIATITNLLAQASVAPIKGLTLFVGKIDVPLFGQPSFYYCVPACMKMVLEYARQEHGGKIPRLSIKTIGRHVRTRIDGTAPKDVELVNQALQRSQPSVEFETGYLGRFTDITEELANELPVIVWMNCVEPPDVLWHAVVVTGFDPHTNTVFYNDPDGPAEKEEEVGRFVSKWGIEARWVKVLIGRVQQRRISEWTP